jgi:uncharacterized protein YndB with AHSA1/START domain
MINDISVRKTVVVHATQEHAFNVFCQDIARWWPLDYHIGEQEPVDVVMERQAGGRWYEKDADGRECDWGRVLEFDPPRRIVLNWQISPEWKADPKITSEVDVQFFADGENQTRVELEHRNLDTFGDKAEMMRGIFDGERGWGTILARYTALVA